MVRRTKIVCTLGPASSDPETIRGLVRAGMDVVRLNFSHGEHEDHRRLIEIIRSVCDEEGRVIPILQDLQGPKIRVGNMPGGGVMLEQGRQIALTTDPSKQDGRIYINYPTLPHDVSRGSRILIDDGLLELEVLDVGDTEILTEVIVGGMLRSRKGVNLPNIRTSTPSLTEKDLRDLEFGLRMDVDIMALSFVRDESDVADLMARVRESGKNVKVIAKIEKPEAVRRIDEILAQSDGIMVARGDLGIEMPISKVPSTQKMTIHKCMAAAKPVITATQMLESMIENPRPTRAEASDVANAVLDGSDALMLSGETAVGKHPPLVVEVMSKIILEAEQHWRQYQIPLGGPDVRRYKSEDVTESVSYTAVDLADQVGAAAIACLTASGATARAIARHRPSVPLYAFTDDDRVMRQLSLVWGTKAFTIPFQRDTDEGVETVHRVLSELQLVKPGDLVVITAGMPLPSKGRTNMVHVSRV